jgi:hypothetical protein
VSATRTIPKTTCCSDLFAGVIRGRTMGPI